jgi:CRP-like cAMP-binding protein
MAGRDSLAGGSSAFDNMLSLNRAVVQIGGPLRFWTWTGFASWHTRTRHSAPHSRATSSSSWRKRSRGPPAMHHTLEARLSRWLLHCNDFTGSDDIALTQEFLAEMLGTRRTSVSLVAHTLQMAGYRRGHIRLLDIGGAGHRLCAW